MTNTTDREDMKYKTRSVEEIQTTLANWKGNKLSDLNHGFIRALEWVLIPDEEERYYCHDCGIEMEDDDIECPDCLKLSHERSIELQPDKVEAVGNRVVKTYCFKNPKPTKQEPIKQMPNIVNGETRLIAQTCLKKINELVRAVNAMRDKE